MLPRHLFRVGAELRLRHVSEAAPGRVTERPFVRTTSGGLGRADWDAPSMSSSVFTVHLPFTRLLSRVVSHGRASHGRFDSPVRSFRSTSPGTQRQQVGTEVSVL